MDPKRATASCTAGIEIPTELAQLASGADDINLELESTLPMDSEQFDVMHHVSSDSAKLSRDRGARRGKQCPYERYHRQDSMHLYRMPVDGVLCCNFCRRRLQEWVNAFAKARGFHPMYDPAAFQTWAKDTFKPTRLLRFNPLFDGLRLGVLEDVDVKLGRDRLGFFQTAQSTGADAGHVNRRMRLAALSAFAQLDDETKSGVLRDMIRMTPNAAALISDQVAPARLSRESSQAQSRAEIDLLRQTHEQQLLLLKVQALEAENQQLRQWQEQHGSHSSQHDHDQGQLQQVMQQQPFSPHQHADVSFPPMQAIGQPLPYGSHPFAPANHSFPDTIDHLFPLDTVLHSFDLSLQTPQLTDYSMFTS